MSEMHIRDIELRLREIERWASKYTGQDNILWLHQRELNRNIVNKENKLEEQLNTIKLSVGGIKIKLGLIFMAASFLGGMITAVLGAVAQRIFG